MAEKKDSDLIGFDPLAWMNTDNDEQAPNTGQEEFISVVEQEDVTEPYLEDLSEQPSASQIAEKPEVGKKLVLESTHTIQNINTLYDEIEILLENQSVIEIDASAVMSIDTATLQLLIIFKQTAVKLGKEVVIDFPSDKFIEAAKLLGLSEMLNVDRAAAGFF